MPVNKGISCKFLDVDNPIDIFFFICYSIRLTIKKESFISKADLSGKGTTSMGFSFRVSRATALKFLEEIFLSNPLKLVFFIILNQNFLLHFLVLLQLNKPLSREHI